jgi:hypothetical protein
MDYLPPFGLIRGVIESSAGQDGQRVRVSYEGFLEILRKLISGIAVDEIWYLRTYEDIAAAVRSGEASSAKEHFLANGYLEGRLPFAMPVDEHWYLTQNPDVAEGILRGDITSAQDHFDKNGYQEGRLPFRI